MIFKKIKQLFSNCRTLWRSLKYYVIADPSDNSITLSKALFEHIKDNARETDVANVFMFLVNSTRHYAFMVNPNIDQPTQLCTIQYNDKYHCIGFVTLCPSVGHIFYNYGLPATTRVKLSISIHKTPQGNIYYQLDKPNKL